MGFTDRGRLGPQAIGTWLPGPLADRLPDGPFTQSLKIRPADLLPGRTYSWYIDRGYGSFSVRDDTNRSRGSAGGFGCSWHDTSGVGRGFGETRAAAVYGTYLSPVARPTSGPTGWTAIALGPFSQWVACKEKRKAWHRVIKAVSKAETSGFRGLKGRVRKWNFSRLCVGFIAPIVLQFLYSGA